MRFQLLLPVLLFACSSSEISTEDAKAKAAAIVPEAVVDGVAKEAASEGTVMVVTLHMPNGAPITMELLASTGEVIEIVGKTPPFEYEIAPTGLLKLSDAKAKAFTSHAGTLVQWEVSMPKTMWEIYVRDVNEHLWEIKMNSTDGTITSVVEKPKPD